MIAGIIKWVGGDLFRAPFVALLLLVMWHSLVIAPGLRADVREANKAKAQAEQELTAEQQAHAQSNINHHLAVQQAEAADRANVQRVKADAAAKTKEIVDDLETRLADARRRAADADRRLRGQANAATTRASGSATTRMPAVPTASRATGEAAGDNRLPASGNLAGDMTINERLIATEQALQLDALIQWVEAMGLIDVNGPEEEPRRGVE